jgi:hypothetical protein
MDHAGVSPMRSGSGLCGRCASRSPAHLPIGDGPSRQALPVPRSDPAHRTPPQNGVVLVVAAAHRTAHPFAGSRPARPYDRPIPSVPMASTRTQIAGSARSAPVVSPSLGAASRAKGSTRPERRVAGAP